MASIWQRGKNKMWVAQFYVSTGKGKGRCVTRSLRTKNKKVAHERKAQLEAELQLGLFEAGSGNLKDRLKMIDDKLDAIIQPQSSSTPLAKFWDLYQDHLLTKNPYAPSAAVKRKSYSNEVSRIRTFRSWLEPEHPEIMYLEEITPEVISSFLMHRKTGAGNSNSTVNHYRQILYTLFEFARAQAGYTCPLKGRANPVKDIKPFSARRKAIYFLSLEQVQQQLKSLAPADVEKIRQSGNLGQKYAFGLREAVATLIYAGLRREELLMLTHSDVVLNRGQDAVGGMILIRSKQVDGIEWHPKTGINRSIPISRVLHQHLKEYDAPKDSPWYFPGPRSGRPWNVDNFSQVLRIINLAMGNCEVTTTEDGETGLRAWSSLDYRHTFGSHLAMRGESLYKIATLMGNSPEIARQHYAELLPESMRDSVEFDEPRPEQSGQVIRFQDYLAG